MIKRECQLSARCTPAEYQALQLIAEVEQRQQSAVLREIVRNVAKQYGLWPPESVRVIRIAPAENAR